MKFLQKRQQTKLQCHIAGANPNGSFVQSAERLKPVFPQLELLHTVLHIVPEHPSPQA